jgi:glycosyltransferase involved in cell wall biosynthesis
MKTVMIALTGLGPGGAERLVYETATRLDPDRFAPVVVSLDHGKGEIGELLRQADVAVVGLGCHRRNLVACVRGLGRAIAEHRPDLLHTHLFHANLAGRLAVRSHPRLPVLSHVHVVERRWRPWQYWLDARTARYCLAELCVSPSVLRHHAQRTGLPEGFFRLVPNGIDLARFPQTASLKQPLVVAVGHLRSAQKGFDVLLDAWPRVVAEQPAARLVIAGEGPEERRLRRRCAAMPDRGRSVELAGFVADVPALLATGAVFCMPSRWEGSPLACMEAMAAGLPVVGSKIGPIEELVSDGVEGLLVAVGDADRLAWSLVTLLRDGPLRSKLGQNSRRRAQRDFDVGRMVRRLEELYTWAIDAGPPPAGGTP